MHCTALYSVLATFTLASSYVPTVTTVQCPDIIRLRIRLNRAHLAEIRHDKRLLIRPVLRHAFVFISIRRKKTRRFRLEHKYGSSEYNYTAKYILQFIFPTELKYQKIFHFQNVKYFKNISKEIVCVKCILLMCSIFMIKQVSDLVNRS